MISIDAADLAGLPTPAIVLHEHALKRRIEVLRPRLESRLKRWRQRSCGMVDVDGYRLLVNLGCRAVAVDRINEAEAAVAAGFTDVLITQPIVHPIDRARLVELCRRSDPLVMIDRYAPAPPLSEVCVAAGVRVRALIEIDLGGRRGGMRPGRDAVDLALGVNRLPGLTLCGVFGVQDRRHAIEFPQNVATSAAGEESSERPSSAATDEAPSQDPSELSAETSLSLLAMCQRKFRRENIAADLVIADCPEWLPECCQNQFLTDVVVGRDLYRAGGLGEFPSGDVSLTVRATVISRPSLNRVVVNAGWTMLGRDALLLSTVETAGAVIVRQFPDATVISLSGDSLELKIGDGVLFGPTDVDSVLRSATSIHLLKTRTM